MAAQQMVRHMQTCDVMAALDWFNTPESRKVWSTLESHKIPELLKTTKARETISKVFEKARTLELAFLNVGLRRNLFLVDGDGLHNWVKVTYFDRCLDDTVESIAGVLKSLSFELLLNVTDSIALAYLKSLRDARGNGHFGAIAIALQEIAFLTSAVAAEHGVSCCQELMFDVVAACVLKDIIDINDLRGIAQKALPRMQNYKEMLERFKGFNDLIDQQRGPQVVQKQYGGLAQIVTSDRTNHLAPSELIINSVTC